MSKKLINLSNLQKFLLKLNERFALKKAMKGITEDSEGNIIIGEEGLVPTPDENSKGKFLRSDGTWSVPSDSPLYETMSQEEGIEGVSEVDRVINAKTLKAVIEENENVVHTSGNETIGGTKTFTNTPFVSSGSATTGIYLKNTAIARNEVPKTTYYSVLRTLDKNDEILGDYVVMKTDKGATNAQINIRSEDSNGNQLINAVNFSMSNDNSSVSFAPSISNKVSLGTSTYKWAKIYSDDVVHTSGNEDVSGVKTFTDNMYIKRDGPRFRLQDTRGTKGTKPESSIYNQALYICDANQIAYGGLHHSYLDDSRNQISLISFSGTTNDNEDYAKITVGYDGNGKWFTYAPTPAETDNSTKIATTEFVSKKDENVVHKSGSETIAGTKTFSNQMYLGSGGTGYGLISAKDNNSILRLFGGASAGTGANLDLYGEGLNDGSFSLRARTSDKIVGLDGKIDGTLKWNGKDVALDENLVHKSGNETINGIKMFTDTIHKKNSALDLQVNPSSDQFNSFLFTDKNNAVMGYLEHIQTTSGVNAMGLYAKDKSNKTHGFQVTSEDNVIPLGNGVVNLGLSGHKWKNVYATTFNGNLKGNADTSTQFSANKSVTLTGDVTGTASSKGGWSVATTLAKSGVTAGTYGPSANVTGNNNATISVPQITVDAKGRVTSVVNRTLTCKNNTYTVPTKVSQLTNDNKYVSLTALGSGSTNGIQETEAGSIMLCTCDCSVLESISSSIQSNRSLQVPGAYLTPISWLETSGGNLIRSSPEVSNYTLPGTWRLLGNFMTSPSHYYKIYYVGLFMRVV